MDKTVELVMVIVAAVVVTGILLFVFQGQSDDFTEFLNLNSEDAKCDYYRSQYESNCGDVSWTWSVKTKGMECGGQPSLPDHCSTDDVIDAYGDKDSSIGQAK